MAIQEGIQHGPYISQRQTEQKKKQITTISMH
jgi:hypothetical protein